MARLNGPVLGRQTKSPPTCLRAYESSGAAGRIVKTFNISKDWLCRPVGGLERKEQNSTAQEKGLQIQRRPESDEVDLVGAPGRAAVRRPHVLRLVLP